MTDAENKRLMRKIFDGLAEGDGKLFWETAADDLTYTVMGSGSWSQPYVGKQNVREQLFKPLRERLEVGPRTIAERIFADENVVIVQARGANVSKSGTPYENRYCLLFELTDGRIRAVFEYADTELVARVLGTFERQHA
jgi:ketosteroid isomerase-like protein